MTDANEVVSAGAHSKLGADALGCWIGMDASPTLIVSGLSGVSQSTRIGFSIFSAIVGLRGAIPKGRVDVSEPDEACEHEEREELARALA